MWATHQNKNIIQNYLAFAGNDSTSIFYFQSDIKSNPWLWWPQNKMQVVHCWVACMPDSGKCSLSSFRLAPLFAQVADILWDRRHDHKTRSCCYCWWHDHKTNQLLNCYCSPLAFHGHGQRSWESWLSSPLTLLSSSSSWPFPHLKTQEHKPHNWRRSGTWWSQVLRTVCSRKFEILRAGLEKFFSGSWCPEGGCVLKPIILKPFKQNQLHIQ